MYKSLLNIIIFETKKHEINAGYERTRKTILNIKYTRSITIRNIKQFPFIV
jgi:hypothetical protein